MAKAKVIITADNQLKKGIDPAKKSMLEFQTVVDGVQKKISKAFSIASIATAAVAGFKAMTNAAKQCVSDFNEAEKVSRRLDAVWQNVGKSTNKTYAQIMDYSDAIEKQTYFTGEAVEEAALLLAATESLTEDGFQRALDVSVDLAAALGEDVSSAAQTLAKAIQEPESALSRLKTIGVSFTEDEKEQIKALTDANKLYEAQSIILDKVESKYEGVAKAVADTPTGTLDAIKDTWGDIKEDLGEGIVGALAPAFTYILEMLKKIHEWARDHLDQNNFWNDVESFDSNVLYQGYTEDFLKKRQTEARSDVAAQLELIKNSPWGQWISEAIETPLEDLLWMENSTLEKVLKDYLPEDFEYTLEGFFEDLKEPYDKLAKTSETIDNALDLYKKNYSLGTPDFTGNSTETAVTEVTNALEEFLKSYGNASDEYTRANYETMMGVADSLRSSLVFFEDQNNVLLKKSYKEFGLESSEDVSNAYYYLTQIMQNLEGKIDNLNPEIVITPSATLAAKLGGGKLSLYDEAGFSSTAAFGFTGKNTKNNNPGGEVYTPTFLEDFAENLAGYMKDKGWGNEDQTLAAATSVTDTLINNLGEAGSLISNLAQNMATMGPVLGAIVTALEYVVEGFAAVLGDTLNEFVQYGLEPLREFGRMIGEVLMPIMDAIMPSVKATADFLIGIFQTIGSVLEPIAHIIGMVIKPVLQAISVVLEFILPFIEALGNAIITVVGTIEWMVSWVEFIWGTLANAIASIHVGDWYPFRGMGGNKASRPDSLVNHLKNSYIDSSSASIDSASTETAISSASYRGATQVTINIYQMSPVVGENGMREFAQMIRDEFEALDYYGVSA